MATSMTRQQIDRQARRIKRETQIAVLEGLIADLKAEDKADGEEYAASVR